MIELNVVIEPNSLYVLHQSTQPPMPTNSSVPRGEGNLQVPMSIATGKRKIVHTVPFLMSSLCQYIVAGSAITF